MKEYGESEPGYDEWSRTGVEEALADPSPDVPHKKAMEEFRRLIHRAREKESRYNSAMSPKAQEVLEQARQLSPEEQDWLAECLLIKDDSIGFDEAEAAWGTEIKRRLDEIDSGAVEMIPLEDVLARMDARRKSKLSE